MNVDTRAIGKLFELSTIHGLSIVEVNVDEPVVCLITR